MKIWKPQKASQEMEVVKRILEREPLKQLQPAIARDEIIQIKEEIQKVKVHDDIMAYAVEIARNTRKSSYLTLGASPRAAIALTKAARSRAYLEGRSYTIPEDVTYLAEPVLLHRFVLSPEARLQGKKAKDVLREAMSLVKVPVL